MRSEKMCRDAQPKEEAIGKKMSSVCRWRVAAEIMAFVLKLPFSKLLIFFFTTLLHWEG